jgi:hypothetical protein
VSCRSRVELSPTGPGTTESLRGVLLHLSLEFWREGVCVHRTQLYAALSVVVTLAYSTAAVGGAQPSLAVLVGGRQEYVFEGIAAAAAEDQSSVDVFAASVSSRYRVHIVAEPGVDQGGISGSSGVGAVVEDAGLYRTHFEHTPTAEPTTTNCSDSGSGSGSAATQPDSSLQQQPQQPVPAEAGASQQCVICMDAPKCVVLMPCKHYCACEDCAGLLQQCPLCRKMVIHTLKIFNS